MQRWDILKPCIPLNKKAIKVHACIQLSIVLFVLKDHFYEGVLLLLMKLV